MALCLAPGLGARADSGERWDSMSFTAFKRYVHNDISSGLCFAQDRQGFVWIGTQAGLVRWDGNRHVKYLADARDDALPDSYVMSVHVDTQGRLWAGMNSGGLVRYDPEHDNFIRYRASPTGLRDPRVAAMADDGAGGLWIATGSGLEHLAADGKFNRLGDDYGAAALPEGGIDALLHDADGGLWVGTRRGLFHLKQGQAARQILLGGKPNMPISALLKDSDGRLWIGSRNGGAFVIAPGDTAATPVHESAPQATLHGERISAIVEAAPGEIWFGTNGANGGIVVYDVQHHSSRRIRHRADAADSLADNDVMAMFRERSGIIYASNMAGISQHAPQPDAVATIRYLDAGRSGIISVPSTLVTPDGRLWLGMINGGVAIVDPKHGLSRWLLASNGMPQGRVLTMAAGPGGEVYIGTQNGLYRAAADGSHVQRVKLPQRRDEEEVWALAVSGNTLWMGGLDGVWALELGQHGVQHLLRHEDKSLGDPRVTSILPVGNDVWVGTRTGLARVGVNEVEAIPADLSTPDRLPPGYVSSLLLDGQGRLWLSNFGTGVVILERTDPDGRRRFRRLGMQQGLPDSGGNKLLQDRQGMIWASTDAGLARIDPRTLEIKPLGPGEGVHVPTYWTNSGTVTASGDLVFGGLTGITVVKPQALESWRYVPPVVVTRIVLNDKDIPFAAYNQGRGAKAAPIVVPTTARERGFSLEFAALDYTAPERNRYAYQLKGFDSNWVSSEASSRRASYNNLPPGDYVLQLRGSNRNGDWATPVEVPVHVMPAWHQRPLARVAMGALGLLLGAGLMQARTTYLRRRQRELEAMVEARTAELRATQAQLETLAYGDPLTGLANRRLFNDELRHLVAHAERGGPAFTLLLIDLDRFKPVNDTLGHDAGDALLAATADRLRAAVREADRPFRLGGDEFAVLLSQTTDCATLEPVCARILANLAAPLPHGDAVIEISASIGAAVYASGNSHEQLYKRADVALYEAKAAGRNTWRLAAAGQAAHALNP
ncbi:ligand-binding sensor domain-containing diguanylate cyclase [Duganella sp. OV510]|nr:ligand-binding sensor domain-containing diguanylate cyclase [Duganella sp. OV510]SDG70404.1 diguanylate cyclase (GGDEF) domain-containing protein [Duganella sp. OV458]SDJ95877.1 diguanylate cyclase (GGDEF) domain-containing protein [Duganella sp. OV510]